MNNNKMVGRLFQKTNFSDQIHDQTIVIIDPPGCRWSHNWSIFLGLELQLTCFHLQSCDCRSFLPPKNGNKTPPTFLRATQIIAHCATWI